jgi:RNA polymerase sigma-70 factor (ECF subfamily)
MQVARPAGRGLEGLLPAYRARIHRYIQRLVHDRCDAEDLTQETLLRAQQELGALQDPAALGGWLRRIAANACTDFLRGSARRRGGRLGALDGEGGDQAAGRPGAAELIDRARMSACGARFLRRLPEPYREVILLHDLLGLTSAEVARRLGCTPGAVKIRLHRARQRFRAMIEEGCDLDRDGRGVLVGGAPKRRGR